MKSNNKKSKRFAYLYYGFISFVFMLYGLLSIGILPIKIDSNIFLAIAGIFILYVLLRGFQWYTFDTAGETVTIISKRYDLFSFINSADKKIDLPKYKLNNFELNPGLINDDLTLFINSRKNKSGIVKTKLKISFLTKDERKKIIAELNKIVEINQYQLDSKLA